MSDSNDIKNFEQRADQAEAALRQIKDVVVGLEKQLAKDSGENDLTIYHNVAIGTHSLAFYSCQISKGFLSFWQAPCHLLCC